MDGIRTRDGYRALIEFAETDGPCEHCRHGIAGHDEIVLHDGTAIAVCPECLLERPIGWCAVESFMRRGLEYEA